MDELIRQGGVVARAAKALGIRQSSMVSRLEAMGLVDFAARLKPRTPTPAEERRQLVAAIEHNDGCIVDIGAELGITRNTVRARLRRHGLEEEAEARRIETARMGTRKRLGNLWNAEERRARLIAILKSTGWSIPRASRVAGFSVGTMYNRMRDLKIDRHAEMAEQRFHRLVDALRAGNGVLARAARHIGVEYRTIGKWCQEFEVEPSDFRR